MSQKKSDQEKTEEPTQRRIDKAREEGNVSISKEVSSVLLMVVSMIVFVNSGAYMYRRAETMFETFLLNSRMALANQENATEYLKMALGFGFEMMLPVLIALLVVALLVNLVQTGGVFSLKAIQPKGSKMNPATGLKRIFSMQGLVELGKGVVKLGIVVMVVYYTVRHDIDHFISFAVMPIGYSIAESGSYVLLFVGRILAALLVLSIADAAYQRFQHKKELRMSKQEVKDEHKEMEGDPHVKSQRRKMGQSFRQKRRLDHAVLDSDVVVTNPTHYAVALKYDPENSNAPVVMAKGQRLKAQKIKKLAREHDIPMVENKPVARALFASAEVDDYVPEDLFRAVAEILAYVYKLKNKRY